jgi:hypothetical protein
MPEAFFDACFLDFVVRDGVVALAWALAPDRTLEAVGLAAPMLDEPEVAPVIML